jgi:hypothetical protein
MKNNSQKGFIVPLIIGIVAVLIIAGAYLVYKNESGQGEESDQASGQFLISTTTNSTSTASSQVSTNSQPSPVITSINPSSGPIGTIVELKGNNLAGFEGELDAWIENGDGEKAFLPGIGSVPRADQTIRVKIDSQLCKKNLSYKGGPCSSYMTITPGTYKIYTYPWGNMSNTVQFTVTASASSTVSTSTLQAIINGRNARLIADMSQLRVLAEFVYNANQSYQTLCQNNLININAQVSANSSLVPTVQDIINNQEAGPQVSITPRSLNDQSKIGLSCVSKADKYAIGLVFATSTPSSTSFSGLSSSFCIDSTGHAGGNKQFVFDAPTYSCRQVQ